MAPERGPEGLPPAFLQSLRPLYNILDDQRRGYVHLREIESRWRQQGADAEQLPRGVLEGLRRAAPASGYLTFERFVLGLRLSLLSSEQGVGPATLPKRPPDPAAERGAGRGGASRSLEKIPTNVSGGPLMCRMARSERFWLVGLNSWGSECKVGKVPGVFTSIQMFLTWIQNILRNPPISALVAHFKPTTPTTPSTPTPPPPIRWTGEYYANPIYKRINGVLIGFFPEATTRYRLPTFYWSPTPKRTTWPWYTGPKRTFAPFTFPPFVPMRPTPTTAFPGWGKGPSIIYRLPRRRVRITTQPTYSYWARPYHWNKPHL